jgi:hypothetical protein
LRASALPQLVAGRTVRVRGQRVRYQRAHAARTRLRPPLPHAGTEGNGLIAHGSVSIRLGRVSPTEVVNHPQQELVTGVGVTFFRAAITDFIRSAWVELALLDRWLVIMQHSCDCGDLPQRRGVYAVNEPGSRRIRSRADRRPQRPLPGVLMPEESRSERAAQDAEPRHAGHVPATLTPRRQSSILAE